MTRLLAALPLATLAACKGGPAAQAGAPPPAPPATSATDWPLTRGGPSLQGRVHAPAPNPPTIEWTLDLGQPITAEAAIADNAILVGDSTGILHCIDLASHASRWTWRTGDTIQAAPALSNRQVFVGSDDGTFTALDLATGHRLWSVRSKEKFSSAPTVVDAPDAAGRWVLVNGYDGITRCLRATDGSEVWTYHSGDHIHGTPAVLDGSRVAFGGCDKAVHVLALTDGTLARRIPLPAQVTNSVAAAGSTIFCGTHGNQVLAVSAEAPAPLWTYRDSRFPFFSAPAVDDHHVYLGCRDKSLHAIHRSDGSRAWTFTTGGRIDGAPLAFDDAIVFGSADGRLYAAHPADGTELWRLDLGEDLTAPPAFAHGRLILGGGHGTLFIIATQLPKQPTP